MSQDDHGHWLGKADHHERVRTWSRWYSGIDREAEGLSYAVAVQHLLGVSQPDQGAVEAYREVSGTSRDVASRHVMEKLGLEDESRALMTRYRASEPWD